MAKTCIVFHCVQCGWRTAKWVGRCGECQAWGTVMERGGSPAAAVSPRAPATLARPIADVDLTVAMVSRTGMDEFDRVLGGGMVPGAVLLLAGEPGVGKSTLLLEVAALVADQAPVLYVTGEESAAQVRLRAERVGALPPKLYLAAETDLAAVLGHIEAVAPELVVVDSIQTISGETDGVAGGVTQVREVAANLTRMAKERDLSVILVGHVTKDGAIAGPRVLEHLVDVVLYVEGDRHSRLRMMRAVKNRFGPTDEIGCFELSDAGIVGLPDPSGLFLSQRANPVAGTCVTATLEGRRPLLAEVQALVVGSHLETPRRTTSGLDSSRVAMLLAVLQRHGRVRLAGCDVYAATVGGVRLTEPSVDLAVAMAVAGAAGDFTLAPRLVAIGEVGLAGEVRRVPGVRRRLNEAARLGFTQALVPPDSVPADPIAGDSVLPQDMTVTEVADISAALRTAIG